MKIRETHPIKGLDVSLAWMDDTVEQLWPNFLRDFYKMGFGYVSTFPLYFIKGKDGDWSPATQNQLDLLKKVKAQSYGIVYNESPFHVMWFKVQADKKARRSSDEEADQLFTQIDGKRGKWMNILYRGKSFQNEITRIADSAALVQPDQVYLDIEW